MWKHYLTIHGSRGQCCIQQARYVPNQFQVEYQGKSPCNGARVLVRVGMYSNWRAYAMAYTTAHGARTGSRFSDARFSDLGF